mmetsp:Transcript_40315/g.89538  ORF Transcript_40315/g.89538 Transcript_40315/m.89538 type:complete len:211 (+) Transcript_40315:107-739(+)|eukprot:CAMPEP_0202890396 /NCGR_PEP_ID=MMETSP1392-20130828/813_1 /ASSEMBLY_ACC=CAM_ASM_000868 /TAXON_ID=225041 /ORGANISM="Chlamydomonas chlamydogama, Strain SAG 11-48b" /LENGTH=210 /DNA_ID=CAMNT_0049573953 /DNA_START=78 /DNA_END=710 /DNA_ORIENTATION=-
MRVVLFVILSVGAAIAAIKLSGDPSKATIAVIKESATVEKYLQPYKNVVGTDYEGYRGHCYRVLTYAMHMLHGDEKYRDAIEAALVFHDIALWSAGELDYLDPSWAEAEKVLTEDFDSEQLQLIKDIIIFHHKVTPFTGPHAEVVEAVRKGDLIDFSLGLVANGVSRNDIAKVDAELPNSGFHLSLLKTFPRLHGFNVPAYLKIGKVFYW